MHSQLLTDSPRFNVQVCIYRASQGDRHIKHIYCLTVQGQHTSNQEEMTDSCEGESLHTPHSHQHTQIHKMEPHVVFKLGAKSV